ncbi:hypothetical protein GWI33_021281 [Rhynchophorus ferrugineus]|uniref:Cilia- and flagella-associated protein 263 n=1 Tax=Rhynchophorus ferrugineus TaxID=354439 RepID=A0A834M4Y2_RHYFE|nr:hypothetical protein GWI33_021281 [Rhynchophorus ferrugineus]
MSGEEVSKNEDVSQDVEENKEEELPEEIKPEEIKSEEVKPEEIKPEIANESGNEAPTEETKDASDGGDETNAELTTEGDLHETIVSEKVSQDDTSPAIEGENIKPEADTEAEAEGSAKESDAAEVKEEPAAEKTDDESSLTLSYTSAVPETDADSKNESIKYDITEDETPLDLHPLDELTDQQVIDIVAETELENKHLELENMLFENFLQENDPTLLEGFDDLLNYFRKKSSTTAIDVQETAPFDKQKLRLDSYTSITSIAEGKGPKINLSQKTDMVMRAMEENQSNLETFLKKSHATKRNLKSEIDEFAIREAEIKEAIDIFEHNVVIQGVDKLTQRIPAEKFVRYMEEWLKSAQLQIEKLRLRLATLKVQYKKVSQQLIQRQELGENVHAVDFDQLQIENKHFLEKIEQKNVHLIELKKMNGGANLILSIHKKYLQKQQEDCNKLKAEIEEKNQLVERTEAEYDATELELDQVRRKYDQCKNLKKTYTVPEVYDYVKLKAKMFELSKNLKIWHRRKKIQDIALTACVREMKRLTGTEEIDPSWFDDSPSISVSSNDILL